MTTIKTINAHDVKVGDILEVWWKPRRDTVIGIKPYEGLLECMKDGWIFEFALLPSKYMTVSPDDNFTLLGGKKP